MPHSSPGGGLEEGRLKPGDSEPGSDSEAFPGRVFQRARYEAVLVLVSWAGFLIWTVGYCAWQGYGRDVDTLGTVFGMPDWVFWGVVLPWVCATLFSFWFGLCFMEDEVTVKGEHVEGEFEGRPTRGPTDSETGQEGS